MYNSKGIHAGVMSCLSPPQKMNNIILTLFIQVWKLTPLKSRHPGRCHSCGATTAGPELKYTFLGHRPYNGLLPLTGVSNTHLYTGCLRCVAQTANTSYIQYINASECQCCHVPPRKRQACTTSAVAYILLWKVINSYFTMTHYSICSLVLFLSEMYGQYH